MLMPVQSDIHQDINKPEYITQGFITFLRKMGVEVPISASITFFQSLAYVTITNRDDVYWAGRSTLVRSPEDIPAYDDAFHAFWEDYIVLGEEKTQTIKEMTLAIDNDNYENDDLTDTSQEGELIPLKYSRSEILRKKDFANYNDDELSEAYELMKSIRPQTLEVSSGPPFELRESPSKDTSCKKMIKLEGLFFYSMSLDQWKFTQGRFYALYKLQL